MNPHNDNGFAAWAWFMSQRVRPEYTQAAYMEWRIQPTEPVTSSEAKVAVAMLVGELILAWRSNPL